jgi:hypothetical protein
MHLEEHVGSRDGIFNSKIKIRSTLGALMIHLVLRGLKFPLMGFSWTRITV